MTELRTLRTLRKEPEPKSTELHVYNELDRLRRIAIWGKPGCETVLGQLLPLNDSLFYETFDVGKARQEYTKMVALIANQGVSITTMKDIFLKSTSFRINGSSPSRISDLKERLLKKGEELYAKHHIGDPKVLDLIDSIVDEDVDEFGKLAAIKLNAVLSLKYPLPLANIFYGRDQSNVLGQKIIMSRMRWPIRKPEVQIYAEAYRQLGMESALAYITKGTIEGGDAMMLNGYCFIGVGVRTSREAVAQVCEHIGDDLESKGIRLIAVVDEEMAKLRPETPGQEMTAMHWDTWIAPLDKNSVLANMAQVEKRHIEIVRQEGDKVVFTPAGSLMDHLSRMEVDIIPISDAEQANFGPNFLHLGNGSIVVPLHNNNNINLSIENRGVKVLDADIQNLTRGYGAVHCMTAALSRK